MRDNHQADRFRANLYLLRLAGQPAAVGRGFKGFLLLLYRSIWTGVAGVREYGKAVSRQYGISTVYQFLRLALEHYVSGASVEDFYFHQFYLPEGLKSRRRHLAWQDSVDAQRYLVNLLASPDAELLRHKDKFAAACRERNLPTIPVLAEFFRGEPDGPCELPSVNLFSKPANLYCGKGARLWVYDPSTDCFSADGSAYVAKETLAEALRKQSKRRKILVQPAVKNHSDMALITNGSLATVRIVTCRAGSDRIQLLPPVLRLPYGPLVTDNFAGGGMIVPLDAERGTITGPAVRKSSVTAIEWLHAHPDTDTPLAGFKIPSWPEIQKLAVRAHIAFSSLPFIAWDIAALQSGPTLIEGNDVWDPYVLTLPHNISLSDTVFVSHYNNCLARLWQ